MTRVSQQLYGLEFSWEGVEFAGNLDPLIFREVMRRNDLEPTMSQHERFRATYSAELRRELADGNGDVRLLPGVEHVIVRLRRRADVALGLLTGNYAETAPLKVAAAGLDPSWFQINAFGDEGESRAELVELAMSRFHEHHGTSVDPRRVIVIGDTPKDVASALAHGCHSFAVATGQHRISELEAAGAHHVGPDLSDGAPLLRLVELHS